MERIQEFLTFLAAALSGMIGIVSQDISFIALPLPPREPQARVLFVGDIMLDRSVRTAMETHGAEFIFSCIRTHLSASDFVVGNLEGPITPNPSRSVGSVVGSPDNFVFTFPEYVAPLLYRENFRAVSLGNNHIYNFGEDGVHDTVNALEQAHVGYFGEPGGRSVSQIDQGGVQFTFIGYNEFDAGWTEATTIKQIQDARALGRQPVVFAHWGDEYSPASERQ
ncbi:MAG: CapA family protein, partial [Candidatus Pacebacteria bacterium]|nr:CapA family protein [Candidatus Paceibacterota bacterium]